MPDPAEAIVQSCLFIQNVGCYEVAKDFSGQFVALLVTFFGVRFTFSQISEQHQNTLDAQKEESKRNTRIELFKEISSLLDNSASMIRDVSTYCMIKKYSNLEMKADINHEEYFSILNKFGSALLAVISKIESHEIVHLKLFRVFRYSLQSIHHDLMALQFEKDRANVLERILKLTDDAQSYCADFQVCMQNIAYGEILNSKVPDRVTVDKSLKVIVDDPIKLDKLMSYFTKETNWGKNIAKYEKEAVEKYHS
jgi:hypothetical protein